jgi:hypothetical protein
MSPLASLTLADQPLLGLRKSRSGTLGIWDGQHEAQFRATRSRRLSLQQQSGTLRVPRADRGDNCFRYCSNGSAVCCWAGRAAGTNGPTVGADPPVRVEPRADIAAPSGSAEIGVVFIASCQQGVPKSSQLTAALCPRRASIPDINRLHFSIDFIAGGIWRLNGRAPAEGSQS